MDKLRIYLNSFGSRISGQDFLLFGSLNPQVIKLSDPTDADYEIYMSPFTMKLLQKQMTSAVEQYEKVFGPIPDGANMEALKSIQKSMPEAEIKAFNPDGSPISME